MAPTAATERLSAARDAGIVHKCGSRSFCKKDPFRPYSCPGSDYSVISGTLESYKTMGYMDGLTEDHDSLNGLESTVIKLELTLRLLSHTLSHFLNGTIDDMGEDFISDRGALSLLPRRIFTACSLVILLCI